MKIRYTFPALALALAACHLATAQAAPANAPAGSTGMCKDGTFSSNATKSGACSGHKGVAQWYAAAPAKASGAAPSGPSTAAAPAPPAKMASKSPAAQPAATPSAGPAAPTPSTARSMPAPSATAAPGGGPGMVWVNLSSKIYHCPGDRYYGKTKDGKYMTESDAQKAGARGERNQTCSK